MSSAVAWDKSFARQKTKLYGAEAYRLGNVPDSYFDLASSQSLGGERSRLIHKFLGFRKTRLDPPETLRYSKLRDFLGSKPPQNSQQTQVVLFDERCDPSGSKWSTRLWDSESNKPEQYGYMDHPPEGEKTFSATLSAEELRDRMMVKRDAFDPGKRIVFSVNVTSDIVLAIVQSIATRTIPVFRGFVHGHLQHKSMFRIHFGDAQAFNLEFHVPFFALRNRMQGDEDFDLCSFHKSRQLPLWDVQDKENYWYHEAQLSFLITGVDEWLWTSYCFVGMSFGGEEHWRQYLDDKKDPSTGGAHDLKFQVWNPREYFLSTMDRRMTQTTREWVTLISIFDERMSAYEQESLLRFTDDTKLTNTKKLTFTVSAIRRFRDSITSTIEAWSIFEHGQIEHLQTTGSDAFCQRWEKYISDVRGNISELKSLRSLLGQRLELFNSMRDGLVNASALRESAASTIQGENIGILTKMTVLYLPLSLATAVFSTSMIPESQSNWYTGIQWTSYILLVLFVSALTMIAARHPDGFLNPAFGESQWPELRPWLRRCSDWWGNLFDRMWKSFLEQTLQRYLDSRSL